MWQLTLELRPCSTPLNTVGAELRRLRRGLHWHSVTGRSIDAAGLTFDPSFLQLTTTAARLYLILAASQSSAAPPHHHTATTFQLHLSCLDPTSGRGDPTRNILDASVRFAQLDEIRQQAVDRRAQHYEEFPAKEKIWKAPRKNDLVLLRNFALDSQKGKKFMPRWRGPYLIDRITATERSAELKDLQTGKIIGPHHIDNLKLYVARDEQSDNGSWKTLVKNDLELANEWAQIKDAQEKEMHGPLPPYFVPFHVNDYQYQKMKYEHELLSGTEVYARAKTTHLTRGTWFWKTTLEYVATDWSWRRFYDPNEALYEALKTSRMAAKQPVPSYESFERVLRRVNDERGTLFVDDRPTPYHPKDQAFRLLPHEPYLAHVARQFRVSIAIAQPFGHSDSLDLLDRSTFRKVWKQPSPGIFFRWARAPHQELHPPIFMGRFMNMWYALSARDPDICQVIANPDVPLLIHNLWDEFRPQKDSLIRKNEIKNLQIAALENQLLEVKAELEVEKRATNTLTSIVKKYREENKALQKMKSQIDSFTPSGAKDGLLQAINHAIETNDKAFKVMLENVTAIAMMEDTSNI
ncbi:hypothetical protein DIS24_g10883 [Lasiodiplodia hormozganensis]|uniref:Uncharacterized protein n=1 Tax=Lasiodiplodia hormozganensis TaxID=869390 RepID=A0AA40C7G0_9PEZI|nr:hypothetical protein DIS24_g10883 [Lasiodiplodia hormozganensis]